MNAITIFFATTWTVVFVLQETKNKCPSQKLLFIHSVYWTLVGFSKFDIKYPSFTYFTIPIFALDIRIIFCSFTKADSWLKNVLDTLPAWSLIKECWPKKTGKSTALWLLLRHSYLEAGVIISCLVLKPMYYFWVGLNEAPRTKEKVLVLDLS